MVHRIILTRSDMRDCNDAKLSRAHFVAAFTDNVIKTPTCH